MKKLIIFFVATFLVTSTSSVLAHFQSTDRTYTGILHVNPDDSPIVGEDSTMVLFMADLKKDFSFYNCDCLVNVTGPDGFELTSTLSTTGEVHVSFPKKGIYKAVFVGNSVDGENLFKLPFDIRVERETSEPPQLAMSNHSPYMWCIGICVVLFIVAIIAFKGPLWKKIKKSQ